MQDDLQKQLQRILRAPADATRVAMPKPPPRKKTPPRSPVDEAMDMVAEEEAFRAQAYLDPVGVPTIGYGHTGPGVRMGMPPWTEAQARDSATARIRSDSARFDRNGYPVLPELLSAAYNLGVGGLRKTGALREAAAGNFDAAADSLQGADGAGGKKLRGLTGRREREAAKLRGRGGGR
jgi:lysozyme